MRSLVRAVLAAGVVVVALGVSGCGSNGSLLTQGAANQLTSDLSQASSALNDSNCAAASSALVTFRNDVSQLQGVNRTLVSMLSQGATTITALAQSRCPTTDTTTTTTDTTTTATDTTTSDTSTDTTTTNTGTGTDTDTTSVTTATNPDTTGGEPFGTVTTTPTATVPTPPTLTAPDSGGAGLNGSTAASGGTGAGAP
jgi:hypothetical protein